LETPVFFNFNRHSYPFHHRSHRERKERYIRNLEQELKRLREAYTAAIGEKATIVEENRQLHATLKQHGINFPYLGPIQGQTMVPVGAAPVATQGIAQLQFGHHYEHDCSQHRHDHNHHVHSYPSPPQLDLSVIRGQGTVLSGQQITVEQYSQIAINLVLAYVVTYISLSRRQIANMVTTTAWKNSAWIIYKNFLRYHTTIPITFKGMSSWSAALPNHTQWPTRAKTGA